MSRLLPTIAAMLLVLPLIASAREPDAAQTIQQLANGIVDKAPDTYFALATELYRAGEKDEAAFWYYVGLIRYRAWMMAKGKDSASSDERYHFYSLSHSVGQSIYQHVDRDSPALIRAIDRALTWDSEQPNGYTSKAAYREPYERARQELLSLRQQIKLSPDTFKTGLPSGSGLISW